MPAQLESSCRFITLTHWAEKVKLSEKALFVTRIGLHGKDVRAIPLDEIRRVYVSRQNYRGMRPLALILESREKVYIYVNEPGVWKVKIVECAGLSVRRKPPEKRKKYT
ncbi:MAG: hypothetical protein RhofKO_19520 [Rhodothermales bacterium]